MQIISLTVAPSDNICVRVVSLVAFTTACSHESVEIFMICMVCICKKKKKTTYLCNLIMTFMFHLQKYSIIQLSLINNDQIALDKVINEVNNFVIFAPKHILWMITGIASVRQFQ